MDLSGTGVKRLVENEGDNLVLAVVPATTLCCCRVDESAAFRRGAIILSWPSGTICGVWGFP